MSNATAIVTEVEQRAEALIAKASAPLTKGEAYAKIFRENPQLYGRYRSAMQADVGPELVVTKQDGSTAPSFATAVLRQQLDGLYGLGSALMSTLAAIVSSAASDSAKGPLVQDALAAFTAAVRGAFAEAGIAVPMEKRAGLTNLAKFSVTYMAC
jgi:hypothetical protein